MFSLDMVAPRRAGRSGCRRRERLENGPIRPYPIGIGGVWGCLVTDRNNWRQNDQFAHGEQLRICGDRGLRAHVHGPGAAPGPPCRLGVELFRTSRSRRWRLQRLRRLDAAVRVCLVNVTLSRRWRRRDAESHRRRRGCRVHASREGCRDAVVRRSARGPIFQLDRSTPSLRSDTVVDFGAPDAARPSAMIACSPAFLADGTPVKIDSERCAAGGREGRDRAHRART